MNHIVASAVERVLSEGRENARVRQARDRVSSALTDLVSEAAALEKGRDVYVDTAFLNSLRGLLPGFTLDHIGFGDFEYRGPEGTIGFSRTSSVTIPGQSGRAHRVDADPPSLALRLLDAARAKGIVEGYTVNEGRFSRENPPEPGSVVKHWSLGMVKVVKTEHSPGAMTDTLVLRDAGRGQPIWVAAHELKEAVSEVVMRDMVADEPEKLAGEFEPGKGALVSDSTDNGATGPKRMPKGKQAAPVSSIPKAGASSPGRTRGESGTPQKPGAGRSGVQNKQEMQGMGNGSVTERKILGVEFHVQHSRGGASKYILDWNEAVTRAAEMSIQQGGKVYVDVLAHTPSGARAFGIDDFDPEASVSRRYVISADDLGVVP